MPFERFSEAHVPSGTEIVLDTSIHCCRLKGRSFTDRIDSVLSRFKWRGTSTYTKTEFGNVVLASAQYFLRKLVELQSLEALLAHVGNVLFHHQKYVTWSFNLLRQQYGADDAECTERARLALTTLMKVGFRRYIDGACDRPLADGTCCIWPKKGIQRDRNGNLLWKTPNCKRSKKLCKLDEFFSENREVFERIKVAIDGLPAERQTSQLQQSSRVIREAMADPGILLDYRHGCRLIADVIIAVDSMRHRSMFSQNERESGVLCNVLNQDFYYLPPSEDKGVLVQKTGEPRATVD